MSLLLGAAPAAVAQTAGAPAVDVESINIPSSAGKLFRPGVRITASCSANCLLVAKLRLPRSVAGRLGLTKPLIAIGITEALANEVRTFHARVRRRVAERLREYDGSKRMRIEVEALP